MSFGLEAQSAGYFWSGHSCYHQATSNGRRAVGDDAEFLRIWVSCSTQMQYLDRSLIWGSCQIIIIRNIRQKMTSFLPCCMGTSKVELHYIWIRPKHGKRWFPEAYIYILLVMIHVLLMFNMLPFLLSIFSRWVSGVVPFSDVCTSLPVHCCKNYGLFIVREVYVC